MPATLPLGSPAGCRRWDRRPHTRPSPGGVALLNRPLRQCRHWIRPRRNRRRHPPHQRDHLVLRDAVALHHHADHRVAQPSTQRRCRGRFCAHRTVLVALPQGTSYAPHVTDECKETCQNIARSPMDWRFSCRLCENSLMSPVRALCQRPALSIDSRTCPARNIGEGRYLQLSLVPAARPWIPAFAGMTGRASSVGHHQGRMVLFVDAMHDARGRVVDAKQSQHAVAGVAEDVRCAGG
jgi:hypothetical protein